MTARPPRQVRRFIAGPLLPRSLWIPAAWPRNAAGKTQHTVVNYRPRSALLHFARLMGEKFAGTSLGQALEPCVTVM
jgi:hypothetical protein